VSDIVIPEEAVEAAAKAILDEGGAPGHSLHSWRCERPDRFGECGCVEQTAREVLVAALPALRRQWAEEVALAIEAYRDRPRSLSEQLQRSQYGVITDAAEIVREYGETK